MELCYSDFCYASLNSAVLFQNCVIRVRFLLCVSEFGSVSELCYSYSIYYARVSEFGSVSELCYSCSISFMRLLCYSCSISVMRF